MPRPGWRGRKRIRRVGKHRPRRESVRGPSNHTRVDGRWAAPQCGSEVMKWLAAWQEAMTAAAFAEAGEPAMAESFLSSGKNTRQRVLLGVKEVRFTPRLLRQALEICCRVGVAGLEVLHLLPPGASDGAATAELVRLREGLRPRQVFYQVAFGGDLEAEILRHAAGRRDLALILLDLFGQPETTPDELDQDFLKRLPCPVVLLRAPQIVG